MNCEFKKMKHLNTTFGIIFTFCKTWRAHKQIIYTNLAVIETSNIFDALAKLEQNNKHI